MNRPTGLPRQRLIPLIQELLGRDAASAPVGIQQALSEVGLSSISMVNLMLAVEAQFDLTIPQGEITPENFRSIAAIEALILRLTGQPAVES